MLDWHGIIVVLKLTRTRQKAYAVLYRTQARSLFVVSFSNSHGKEIGLRVVKRGRKMTERRKDKVCVYCKNSFSDYRSNTYCSTICKSAALKTRHDIANNRVSLNSSSTGAVSELLVCADLLRRGYDVYRAVNPDAKCDLVIIRPGRQILRIEVRTAWVTPAGTTAYSKNRSDLTDSIAVVVRASEITYIPDLPDISG